MRDYTIAKPHAHDYGCENRDGEIACGYDVAPKRVAPKRTTRVRAVVDVTLDLDAYAREYGYDPTLDDIAADARDWVRSMVAEGAVVTFAPFSQVVKSIVRPR